MKENRPSATAHVVARNVVLVASTPALARLVPQDAATLGGWLVSDSSTGGRSFVRKSASPWFRKLQRVRERLTIPGLALHQALRKRYIERAVRHTLAEGFGQVVVFGGGLDSLAARLHSEFPEVRFIELDHPATQGVKRHALSGRGLINHNLTLLPVDFVRQSLEESLSSCDAYDAREPALFLAEGLLMYLSAGEVARIFDFVRRQAGGRSRFVFTFMERNVKGRLGFRRSTWAARLWLKLQGEPFVWGLGPGEVRGFLTERGFVLRELATHETFRELYLRREGLEGEVLAEGEQVCVADVPD